MFRGGGGGAGRRTAVAGRSHQRGFPGLRGGGRVAPRRADFRAAELHPGPPRVCDWSRRPGCGRRHHPPRAVLSALRFRSTAALAYLLLGLIAFAPILHVGFMGDDWMFLDVLAKGNTALVAF